MSVAVFIEHRALPGRRDAAYAVWDRLLRPAIEANPAHEAYAYSFDADDPDVIRAFQHYRDGESAAAFLHSDAYSAYVAEVEPLLAGPPVVNRAAVIWTKPPHQLEP